MSGHRNTVLCLHLTSDTYHVTPSGRAPRARGKFWIRRVKLRIFRPDPKSHKSEGFPAAQIFKTHKCQNTYCRSAHFSKAVKFVGAQNPRGTTWFCGLPVVKCIRRVHLHHAASPPEKGRGTSLQIRGSSALCSPSPREARAGLGASSHMHLAPPLPG